MTSQRIVDFDNPHGEPCDLTYADVCALISNCNRVIDYQLTKILPHRTADTILGESDFQEQVDEFLAKGGKVKQYPCVMIVDDQEVSTS